MKLSTVKQGGALVILPDGRSQESSATTSGVDLEHTLPRSTIYSSGIAGGVYLSLSLADPLRNWGNWGGNVAGFLHGICNLTFYDDIRTNITRVPLPTPYPYCVRVIEFLEISRIIALNSSLYLHIYAADAVVQPNFLLLGASPVLAGVPALFPSQWGGGLILTLN